MASGGIDFRKLLQTPDVNLLLLSTNWFHMTSDLTAPMTSPHLTYDLAAPMTSPHLEADLLEQRRLFYALD